MEATNSSSSGRYIIPMWMSLITDSYEFILRLRKQEIRLFTAIARKYINDKLETVCADLSVSTLRSIYVQMLSLDNKPLSIDPHESDLIRKLSLDELIIYESEMKMLLVCNTPLQLDRCISRCKILIHKMKVAYKRKNELLYLPAVYFQVYSLPLYFVPLIANPCHYQGINLPQIRRESLAVLVIYGNYSIAKACRLFINAYYFGPSFSYENDIKLTLMLIDRYSKRTLQIIYKLYKLGGGDASVMRTGLSCVYCQLEGSHYSNHCIQFITRYQRKSILLQKKICSQCGRKHCLLMNNHKEGEFQCRFCVQYGPIYANHKQKMCNSPHRWMEGGETNQSPGDLYTFQADLSCIFRATFLWEELDWRFVEAFVKAEIALSQLNDQSS